MRRSSRKGVAESKAKARASRDLLDAPDHKVLSGMLPSPSEPAYSFNMARDRLKPEKRIPLALLRGKRQNPLHTVEVGPAEFVRRPNFRGHYLAWQGGGQAPMDDAR